jgi:F-type H+-transporting ATPase subunit delta
VTAKASVALGLSGRYATALFDLAVEAKALDAVAASLATLKDALAQSADLKTLMTSPMVMRSAAAAGVAGVATSLKLDSLTSNFLGVLAKNRRLAALPAIIRDFSALAAARRGEISAQVTAAHKLSAAQQKALAAKLKAGLGRDVALDITVDPAILGGLIVRVGSRMIDSSLKTRLGALGQALKG